MITDAGYIAYVIGPRRVGGTYLSGYWRTTYTVLAIDGSWLTVQDIDGHTPGSVRTHCTAWDAAYDRIISE